MFPEKSQHWNKNQKRQIDMELRKMLEEQAISQVCYQKGQFLSCIFSLGNENGGKIG